MAITIKTAAGEVVTTPVKTGPSELSLIMKQIAKEKGDNVVIKGSAQQLVGRLPTGIFEFDYAIGGGFPEGRYSIVYGPESSGKTNVCYCAAANAQRRPAPCNKVVWVDLEGCVSEYSTFIDQTSGQVFTAREVFEQRLPITVRSYDDELGKIVLKPISLWYDNGVKPVFRLSTATTEVEATGNHKFFIKKSLDGPASWVRSDEIEEGWYLARPKADKNWNWGESVITNDQARFIGYMLGDGSFSAVNSPTFCNIDKEVISDLTRIVEGWGGEVITYSDRHHRLIGKGKASKWNPAEATSLIRRLGLQGVTGSDKFIPSECFASREAAIEVLIGLYMTDGTVSNVRPTLAFSNTSSGLVDQMRELWRRLGIDATVHTTKMYQDHHAQQYILSINGIENLRLVSSFMTLLGDKGERLFNWAVKPKSDSSQNREGSVGLSKFKGGLIWDKIQTVEEAGEVQTYDFTVMGTHNYLVNDVIAHNTFDPEWAAKFGINVDELILVKPSYGEECVDLIDALIRAEDVALLVLDSLAVVVGSKEIEQSVEKFDVGTASILVKRLCNKLVIALSQESKRGHNPAVILINQTRMKIGVMFGDPETMPGGQTMKFLSSLTVRIYGKNLIAKDVNPELPAFKETKAVVKKAKVGINRMTFEYNLCMLAHGDLSVGESDSWSKVSSMLKECGELVKAEKGGGWTLFGTHAPTLVMFQDTYQAEKDFAIKCQTAVLKNFGGGAILVEAEGAAAA